MKRIAVVVEGQTELEFIKHVVSPMLSEKSLFMTPFALHGNVSIDRLGNEMGRQYHNFDHVTSLVDLYGFSHRNGRSKEQLEEAITLQVKSKVRSHFDNRRVTAYVQKYEFEGLLFSSPDSFFHTIPDVTEAIRDKIQAVRDDPKFNTPEDINDTQETTPSHRLVDLVPGYNKASDGSLVAKHAGLELIRTQCPGFNAWLSKIEMLGPAK